MQKKTEKKKKKKNVHEEVIIQFHANCVYLTVQPQQKVGQFSSKQQEKRKVFDPQKTVSCGVWKCPYFNELLRSDSMAGSPLITKPHPLEHVSL